MIDDHFLDHLADRHRLASPALDVAGKKPVEAVFRIVRGLLFRQQEHEAVAIGERRPAGTYSNMRSAPGLEPNPVTSVRRSNVGSKSRARNCVRGIERNSVSWRPRPARL